MRTQKIKNSIYIIYATTMKYCMMEGNIKVTSELGVGTAFTLYFDFEYVDVKLSIEARMR